MARRKIRITLHCEGFESLDLDPAPVKYNDLIQLSSKYYSTKPKDLLLSYFNYKVYKFCTIDSDIGYRACLQDKINEKYIAVTLPHQIPKFTLPDYFS